jgi:hypothetical protein
MVICLMNLEGHENKFCVCVLGFPEGGDDNYEECQINGTPGSEMNPGVLKTKPKLMHGTQLRFRICSSLSFCFGI